MNEWKNKIYNFWIEIMHNITLAMSQQYIMPKKKAVDEVGSGKEGGEWITERFMIYLI